MKKLFERFALLGALALSLAACQSMDASRIKNAQNVKNNAAVYCAGTENCEFERYDQIRIIDAESKRLDRDAVHSGILRMHTESLRNPNALYLSVPPGLHEVVIRFYPISEDKAERLHVIHHFHADQRYVFKMYRQRVKQQGSLLNVSAPDPLCVDLMQDQKTIRRFCKPYNVLNGLGEFVEKKL